MEQQSDPLLRRFTLEEEIVFDNQAALKTTNNNPDNTGNNNALMLIRAADILQALGGALDQADQTLDELSSNDLLGSAIFRGCRDLADAVGHLAQQLEDQSQDDRRALANACLQDVHDNNNNNSQQEATTTSSSSSMSSSPQMQELSNMTAEDIMAALSGASTLLRDVEMGLRGIEQDEAEEIADVALTLARLFVASLQTVHSTMVHQEQMDQKKRLEEQSNRFEVLSDDDDDDDDDNDDNDNSSVEGGDRNDSHSTKTRRTGREHEKSSSHSTANSTHPSSTKLCHDRLRVLWPPIGPAVASACEWGKEEAIKQPMLAVALGMTLWPAAVVTAFLGTPLVVGDAIVQHAYNSFQDGPIVSNVEKGAAQVFQCAKLSLLCGKLVGRQSIRVINRQVERNGGIGTIAQNLGGMAVDRVLHPVETVCAVWDGLQWGFSLLQSNWQHVMECHNDKNEERRDALTINTDDEWGQLIN